MMLKGRLNKRSLRFKIKLHRPGVFGTQKWRIRESTHEANAGVRAQHQIYIKWKRLKPDLLDPHLHHIQEVF